MVYEVKREKKRKERRKGCGAAEIGNKRENRWINPSMGMNLLHSCLAEEIQNAHSMRGKVN